MGKRWFPLKLIMVSIIMVTHTLPLYIRSIPYLILHNVFVVNVIIIASIFIRVRAFAFCDRSKSLIGYNIFDNL